MRSFLVNEFPADRIGALSVRVCVDLDRSLGFAFSLEVNGNVLPVALMDAEEFHVL
jgi:hypothetical protein